MSKKHEGERRYRPSFGDHRLEWTWGKCFTKNMAAAIDPRRLELAAFFLQYHEFRVIINQSNVTSMMNNRFSGSGAVWRAGRVVMCLCALKWKGLERWDRESPSDVSQGEWIVRIVRHWSLASIFFIIALSLFLRQLFYARHPEHA